LVFCPLLHPSLDLQHLFVFFVHSLSGTTELFPIRIQIIYLRYDILNLISDFRNLFRYCLHSGFITLVRRDIVHRSISRAAVI
jgi:hypothetical protein